MKHLFFRTLAIACLLVAAIPAVSAFTATLVEPASSATVLHNGDRITFNVNDLADNQHIQFIVFTSDMVPSGTSYILSNWEMPFTLEPQDSGYQTMSLGTYGITDPSFVISKHGGGSVSYTGSTGYVSYDPVPKGVYDITVSGTTSYPSVTVTSWIYGKARAPIPNPSTFTFTLQGFNSGHLRIRVAGPGSSGFEETFTIEP